MQKKSRQLLSLFYYDLCFMWFVNYIIFNLYCHGIGWYNYQNRHTRTGCVYQVWGERRKQAGCGPKRDIGYGPINWWNMECRVREHKEQEEESRDSRPWWSRGKLPLSGGRSLLGFRPYTKELIPLSNAFATGTCSKRHFLCIQDYFASRYPSISQSRLKEILS